MNVANLHPLTPDRTQAIIAWLLEGDPSIRWQVMQDLLDAPEAEVAAERAKVATEGAGAQLLAMQSDDGSWGGAAWNRGWDSTMHVLMLLRDFGLDPAGAAAQRAIARVQAGVTWRGCGPPECDSNPFFAGEHECCINAQVAATGAYFGVDVTHLIERLMASQLSDGGWNCEAESGSKRSSFHTTICVLEALLAHERAAPRNANAVREARWGGQVYLLERDLCRRRSTGEVIVDRKARGADWTRFAFPTWWHYDLLRGLEYLRRAGVFPDARAAEAVDYVRCRCDVATGRWPLDVLHPGRMPVKVDAGEGQPSRWNTLRAWRVLRWYGAER